MENNFYLCAVSLRMTKQIQTYEESIKNAFEEKY